MTYTEELARRWTPDRIATTLKKCRDWPSDISLSAVSSLLSKGRLVRFPPDARISDQGDKQARWGIILSGLVRTSSQSLGGQAYHVDLIGPGSHFGLRACLDQKTKVHDTTAELQTDVLVVSAEVLRSLIKSDADLNALVIFALCGRLRYVTHGLEQFSAWTHRARVAARLCGLARSIGRPHEAGVEIATHLSQDTLAEMIGLSRQRTNKLLRDFERDGILVLNYNRIIVRDLTRLRACAHSSKT